MIHATLRTMLVGVILCASVRPSAAQTTPMSRAFISVSGGYQATEKDFNNGAARSANAEDGRFDIAYRVKPAPSIDIAGGATVWKQLGFRVGFGRVAVSTPATLTGSVPHPFFFNRPRTVSGSINGLNREELAINLHVAGAFAISPRVQVTVFAGPTVFQVRQDVVTDFSSTEVYPYDQLTFGSGVVTSSQAMKVGFGGGGDVAFFFTRNIGVGGMVQFAAANVPIATAGGTVTGVSAGGLKAGAGLHLRF